MVSSKNAKRGIKPSKPSKQKKKSVRVRTRSTVAGIMSDVRAAAWDRLLRDPCSAQLAAPCYGGSDTGYLLRTTEIFQPTSASATGLSPGTIYPADYQFYYAPWNLSTTTGCALATSIPGSTQVTYNGLGFTNFITDNTSVRQYRPVATCLKWLPSGPYSSRQGTVGVMYSSGSVATVGTNTVPIGDALASCLARAPNGSCAHEIRWLPTRVDEEFTTVSQQSATGVGTVGLVLSGVDAVATTTGTFAINGRVEITTVWEWVPRISTGIGIAPKAPLPFTSQQILGSIGDMGAYLLHGVRVAGRGMVNSLVQEFSRTLTGGVGTYAVRGGPQIAY